MLGRAMLHTELVLRNLLWVVEDEETKSWREKNWWEIHRRNYPTLLELRNQKKYTEGMDVTLLWFVYTLPPEEK